MTTFSGSDGSDWAEEYLAADQTSDLARDPNDFRVTRQSEVTVNGLLVPVSETDRQRFNNLWLRYLIAFDCFRKGRPVPTHCTERLTATMVVMLRRAAFRAGKEPRSITQFDYISIDPRDYTIFTAPGVPLPVVSIHTRPERCWFLGYVRFEGALGLSLGRMRVSRPTEAGLYPVTIRTKWRALTNKKKQEEVRDAYQRLIQS